METVPSKFVDNFLIAMNVDKEQESEDVFDMSVVYIFEHNDRGAIGLIINRPTHHSLEEMFEKIDCKASEEFKEPVLNKSVFYGGPIDLSYSMVLHDGVSNYEHSVQISDDVILTISKDVIEQIALGKGPNKYLVALGYSGWAPGQLEKEVAQNQWLTVKADSKVLFDTKSHSRYQAALALLGVDIVSLSGEVGHA